MANEPDLKRDAEYITSLNENLKTHWTKQREQDDDALSVICQEHEVDVLKFKQEGFKPSIYRAGTAQDALDRYNALVDKPIWQVEKGWGSKAEKRSEEGEKWFNLFFWDYEAREGPSWPDVKEDTLAVGRGFREVLPDPGKWTSVYGYPVQGEGEDFDGNPVSKDEEDGKFDKRLDTWKERVSNPPITITYMPASTVQVVLSHNKVIEYVQEVTMLQSEVVDRWPEALSAWASEIEDDSKKGTEEVTVLKYGNRKYVSVVVKRGKGAKDTGDLVGVSDFAHGMGVCPIALYQGFKSIKREPGNRWRSIIKKAIDAIKMLDNLRSDQATRLKAMPSAQYYILQKNRPMEGEKDPKAIAINPMEIKRFYEDAQPGVLQPAHPPPEAESLDNKVLYDLEAFLPDLAKGMTGGASSPAWGDRLKLDQVRNYLKPVVNGIALGARQEAQLICRAIMSVHIGETVYVRRPAKKGSEVIGIGPDEASDIHDRVTAILQTKLPSDRDRDITMAEKAYEFGMDWGWCVEDLMGVENPMEHRNRRMIEDVENSEPYRQKLLDDILSEADMLEAGDAAVPPEELMAILAGLPPEAQQAIAAAQAGGGAPGAPPGPAPMPPGAGIASLQKTGQLTADITGPNPMAPTPGGAL